MGIEKLLKAWKGNLPESKWWLMPRGVGHKISEIRSLLKVSPEKVNVIGRYEEGSTRLARRKLCAVSDLPDRDPVERIVELWMAGRGKGKIKNPILLNTTTTTLNDLIIRYCHPQYGKLRLIKDKNTAKRHLQFWNDKLGPRTIDWKSDRGKDMWPQAIAQIRDDLSVERKPATVSNYMAVLSSVFSFCMTEEVGMCENNPVTRVTKPIKNNKIIRFLDDDELDQLLVECGNTTSKDLYDIVLFCILTGCRRGEMKALKWEEVDFEEKTLVFKNRKNNKDHKFSIRDPDLYALLERRFENAETNMVFPNPNIIDAFKHALKRAGIKKFRFHDLRHTSASYVLQGGGTLSECQKHLGHSSIQSTMRYAHLDTSTTEKTSGAVSARIRRN